MYSMLLPTLAVAVLWPLAVQDAPPPANPSGPHIISTLRGHTDTVYAVATSPDGQLVATGSFDNTVKLWEAATGQEVKTFGGPKGHQKMVLCVALSGDGTLIASGSADNTLRTWDVPLHKPLRGGKSFSHPSSVDAVAFAPGGNLVVSGCHDGKVRIFDIAKNALVKEFAAHTTQNATMIYTLAFTPDGKHLISGGYDQSLKLWEFPAGKLVREFKPYKVKDFEKGHREGVFSAAISPDGKLLASGSSGLERVIKIWNMADGTVVRDLVNPRVKAPAPASHPGSIYGLHFTKEGKLLSAGDATQNKGYLALWDVQAGTMLYGEALPLGAFFSLALAPGDQFLAIGAGVRGRAADDFNNAYLLTMPKAAK